MFKVGDRVIPKIDSWKVIKLAYAECKSILPEDPQVFIVMGIYQYPDDNVKRYNCNCASQGISAIMLYEHLLKAPEN